MDRPAQRRTLIRKIVRITIKSILFLFLFVVVIILLILTPPVQNVLRKQAVNYLEKKLQTKVAVGKIYVALPNKVLLEDVYIEDRQKDTLLNAGSVQMNIDILKLVFKKKIDITKTAIWNTTAKIKRQLPDTVFNFQFIVDAFSPGNTTTASPDTGASAISLGSVVLDKVRLVYKDVITGSDMETWIDHLDTRIDEFDPEHLHFNVPETNVSGVAAKIYQVKPLAQPDPETKDIVEAKQPLAMRLAFKQVNLQRCRLDYRNDVSATYALVDVGKLNVKPNKIDVDSRTVDLDNVSLENTIIAIRFGKKEQARVVATQAKQEVKSQAQAGWRISAASFAVKNNSIQFDNDNSPRTKSGLDYSHLNAAGITLETNDLVLTEDSIAAKIKKGEFKEQSGFVLNEFHADVLYTNDHAYVKDLLIKTPGSELKRYALLKYRSADDLVKNMDRVELDADIENSYIQVKDIIIFAPQLRQQHAFSNPNDTWSLNLQGNGSLQSMHIRDLQFKGLKGTEIDASGTISASRDPNRTGGTLTIRKLRTTRPDIALFAGNQLSSQQINVPEEILAQGTVAGSINNFSTHLAITTSDGSMRIDGQFANLANPDMATYNAVAKTNSLNLRSIMQNRTLGTLTANFTVAGKGLTPEKMDTKFNASIDAVGYNDYQYRNISFDGNIRQNNFLIHADINDPNIDLNGTATGQASANPSFKFEGMIDSIKLLPLHFTTEPLVIRAKLNADVPVMNSNYLEANVFATKALVVSASQRLALDTIQFISGKNDTAMFMRLRSDVANMRISGQYRYTDLAMVFQKSVEPYFDLTPGDAAIASQPYDFSFEAEIGNAPVLSTFLPGIQSFDRVQLNGRASSERGLNATMSAASIKYSGNEINGLKVSVSSKEKQLQINADVQRLKGVGIDVYHSDITATASNNKIDFRLGLDDKSGKRKFLLAGNVGKASNGDYTLQLLTDSLLLNYEQWTISPGNSLTFTKENIVANKFILQKNDQKLSLQSQGEELNVEFSRFQLSTITSFTKSDSLLINGSMNGKLVFRNILRQPVFTSDLNIEDLSMKGDTLGNAVIKVDNQQGDRYNTSATIKGKGNDIALTGSFSPQGKTDIALDLNLAIHQLALASLEGALDNMIKNASGSVNGTISIKGTTTKPIVNGPLNFDKASFAISALGSQFSMDGEKISVTENGFRFDNFVIRDEANNQLKLNGSIQTPNFINYNFDFEIGATNFELLNSTKKQNKLYYGKLIVSSRLHVKGTEAAPAVDGSITVNDGTNLSIVIPQPEPGVVAREGIVEFVDLDAPENDSLFRTATDSLNISRFTGMNITTNIEIKKEAVLNLIIDEANGDFLHIQGEGLISTGIDPSGKITLIGTYELEKGSYEISFNFLHRRFDIQKGSKITWLNEPTKANVDVTATYISNTAPIDLVENQIAASTQAIRNTYLQKLPFQIKLFMSGELLQPSINFDIVLPPDKNYGVSNDIITQVDTRLEQLRQDSGEIDKQVFSLLLMNRFVGQNPLQSKSPAFNASTYAKQSVSKMLTAQLNQLAENLIDGVDLTFNVTSTDDYTTGDRRSRTDLNVGLSKRLLHERLTVALGSNYELEGPKNSNQKPSNIFGDISVNYSLSRDGRYMLRFYRINEYEGIVDGYIIETGISFIISVDYNRIADMIRRKKYQRVDGVQYPSKEK